ncbi:MAG: divalent metal cation transporter [Planctomycetes bacterium]|nr:divalent metal cation transporter [Planctomycetota bacterium]
MSDQMDGSPRPAWWRSLGPAFITACVVFGPGSLIISTKVGARHGYDLLWLLAATGLLMGAFMTMAARVGVLGGGTPCTLIAARLGRPAAWLVGLTLSLICGAFQFSNNLAVAVLAQALLPEDLHATIVPAVLIGFNGVLIVFLFSAKHIYQVLERVMKCMVGVILLCFLVNVVLAGPDPVSVLKGFIPSIPRGVTLALPARVDGAIMDPMVLIASLLGTTFSVAGAFFQGNLVREKGWTIREYRRGIGDSIAGVCVLTGVSMIVMITAATVIPGTEPDDLGQLALALEPLLSTAAFAIFCVGLCAVALNPFLINAMIGGTILADGVGLPAKMGSLWSRLFTVVVLLCGMVVAILALRSGEKPVDLMIIGQALTVIGNPLMAAAILYLANRKDIMGERRNGIVLNVIGGVGLTLVVAMAVRVLWRVILQVT